MSAPNSRLPLSTIWEIAEVLNETSHTRQYENACEAIFALILGDLPCEHALRFYDRANAPQHPNSKTPGGVANGAAAAPHANPKPQAIAPPDAGAIII